MFLYGSKNTHLVNMMQLANLCIFDRGGGLIIGARQDRMKKSFD